MDQSDDDLRIALEQTPESVGIYDPDGTIRYLNPKTESIFGVSLAEVRGRRLFDLFNDAVGNAFHAAFQRVAAGGGPETFDHYYAPFDTWFANDIRLDRGRIHVYARDVTDEKRRARRFETLARISEVAVLDEKDLPGTTDVICGILTDVLDADCSVALLSQDRKWLELVASRVRDPSIAAVTSTVTRFSATAGHPGEALRTRSVVLSHLEGILSKLDETEEELRDVVAKYAPQSILVAPLIVGEEALGVLTVVRRRGSRELTSDDFLLVTAIAPSLALYVAHARRRAEAAASHEAERAAQKRLLSLLGLAGRLAGAAREDDVTRVLIDEGVTALDAAISAIWWYVPEESALLLQRERGLRPEQIKVVERLSTNVVGPFLDCVTTRRPVYVESRAEFAARYTELEQSNRSVPARPIGFAVLPMFSDQNVIAVMAFVFDDERRITIDERTYLEILASAGSEALRRARLYAEGETANRAKDEFLAMLGHELRNPLAPITTALQLMTMRNDAAFPNERAVIERQVKHLSRLVDDLLDVSRITRGKIELRRERTSVARAVERAVEMTHPLFEERRHKLTIDVPGSLAVDADPMRLEQVLSNLLHNAARYTDAGGNVEVRAASRAGRVELTVRDNGVGLAPDVLTTIFDAFSQAPQSSARKEGGLGLGLSIAKTLIELHGGSISARSEGLGRGTSIVVDLAEDAEVTLEDARREVAVPRVSPTSRRILVVDDNMDAAKLLAEFLRDHGHEVRTAFDGPTALNVASELRPEIAVLDIGLPVMDGFELAERLRKSDGLEEVRLIAVTGYGQDRDRARTREAGFEAHLAKPIEIETLLALVAGQT